MQSLKDKLLKAGLVSEEQAKKAEEEKAAKAKPPPREDPRAPAPRTFAAPKPPPRNRPPPAREAPAPRLPKFAPLPGSKEAQRNDAKKQVQLDKFIREKVLAAQVEIELGATVFYFVTRKAKLRRLTLSEAQAKMLEEGKLAVVERPDPDKIEHALVPPEAAAELIAQSEKTVRFWNREGQAVGFLSESEISQRHAEADEPEQAAAAPVAKEPAAPPAGGETWITIKRA